VTKFDALDWYETPLYYDIIFSGDDAREGDFLAALVERFGPSARGKRRKALEPACGSGRMLLELARRRYDVTGFDLSPQMVQFARGRLAKARKPATVFEGRMEAFVAGRGFDLAHCMVNTFKYLLDEASVQSHLRCVADSLKLGGLYVIGLHLTEYEDRRQNLERWVQKRGSVEVKCNIRGWPADRRTRLEKVRSRLEVRDRGVERRTQTDWTFRTYDWSELQRTIAAARWFEHIATFDFEYDIDAPRQMPDDQLDVVIVLRKRGAPRKPKLAKAARSQSASKRKAKAHPPRRAAGKAPRIAVPSASA